MKRKVSTVTTYGRVVIPAKLRRKYSIRKGTTVLFLEEGGRVVLLPLTPEYIRSLRGSLAGSPSALEGLFGERRRVESEKCSL